MTNEERKLADAVAMLEGCREFSALVPEVRVNIVYAPEGAEHPDQVLGVDGRITVVAGMPKASGPIRAGVSDHMARLVIETSRHDPSIRAGLNFRWNEAISEHVQGYCAARGLAFGSIDRAVEPKELDRQGQRFYSVEGEAVGRGLRQGAAGLLRVTRLGQGAAVLSRRA